MPFENSASLGVPKDTRDKIREVADRHRITMHELVLDGAMLYEAVMSPELVAMASDHKLTALEAVEQAVRAWIVYHDHN